jgi:hypothetical protein
MKKMKKLFIILTPFIFFVAIVIAIVTVIHCVLVIYNDFFQDPKRHTIANQFSSLHVSDTANNKDYSILIVTMEAHSSRPISFSVTRIKNNRLLQKTNYYKNRSHTVDPISDIELELPKLVCNKRSIWGNYRAIYKMAFLPSGSVVILDKNITADQKNVTLEYILDNSRSKFIDHESNVEWESTSSINNVLARHHTGWISLGESGGGCITINGSIDDLPVYKILLQIYHPKVITIRGE